MSALERPLSEIRTEIERIKRAERTISETELIIREWNKNIEVRRAAMEVPDADLTKMSERERMEHLEQLDSVYRARSELNDMQKPELETKLQDNLDALQNLRFQKALQQLSDPQQIRYIKREIAQIKTVLREYELGIRKDSAEGK